MRQTAGIAIIRADEGSILLVHPTGKRDAGTYSIPKGHLEAGEIPREAAIREVMEEIGVKAQVKPGAPYAYVHGKDVRLHYWVADGADLPDKIPRRQLQLEEVDWAGFVDAEEAKELIRPYQRPILERLFR